MRLTFLADEWRIDYAGLAADPQRIDVMAHRAGAVSPITGGPDPTLREQLSEPDEAYMMTTAGTAAYVDFLLPDASSDQERTFFLSTQGYYTEWMRPDWIRSGARSEGFEPSPDVVVELMERWLRVSSRRCRSLPRPSMLPGRASSNVPPRS